MAEDSVDNARTWAQCIAQLSNNEQISDRAKAYLTLSRLTGFFGDIALILVPSSYVKDLVENKITDSLREALSAVRGVPTTFAVTIDESILDDDEPAPATASSATPAATENNVNKIPTFVDNNVDSLNKNVQIDAFPTTEASAKPVHQSDEPDTMTSPPKAVKTTSHTNDHALESLDRTRLNDKYTFDTFVVGASNRFAQAAAYAVAESPARAYNPLFIYGGSGLGKTHLLHAAGHYARQLDPSLVVRYVNSEEFTNDFINSVQAGQYKAQEFHRRYRDIDILLIDDIQFLQRAPETMEAFFHTFNTLHNANKQIMITSDLPPKQLDGFEDRMRSRFEMGLMVDVQPPDLETRIAILRKKLEMDNNQDVPHDVLRYIASNISTNIRELEGALTRVQALHSLSRQKMDVSLAESVLKDFLSNDGDSEITAAAIIVQTANYFNISVEEIRGSTRTRALVNARQIAMYLCRELTDMPLTKIGEEFGGRDHTTVMHAEKKITQLMKERHSLFNQVTELTTKIKASVAAN